MRTHPPTVPQSSVQTCPNAGAADSCFDALRGATFADADCTTRLQTYRDCVDPLLTSTLQGHRALSSSSSMLNNSVQIFIT